MSYGLFKMAATASPIYFRFPVCWRLTFKKIPNYFRSKFRQDTSVRGWYTSTSGFWKQTVDILKFYFRFWFWAFHRQQQAFCTDLPNFARIGRLATELWRYIDFPRWRPCHCKSASDFRFVTSQVKNNLHSRSDTSIHGWDITSGF